ncbi:fimbria/pilus periplasmic chaperone [Escherichia coli]|uniref:fimbrial biogenesis chaperone n=1 Tax=Escherichia coli TaxID=562 RepID=UPI0019F5CB1E|nr:fimbria/pilus periplasmic chaperone [Escherichia coli]EGO4413999.1 molecular chaperone [Escherichia coli]EHH7559519.1 molecular chaperone [Escherichia coli]EHO0060312.1 molecular chaperone [Escherichia coli]EID8807146.1 molecular chaperone [Escherichia coli]EIL3204898.1 molecular chaperone [Escherichia coli]
MKYIRDVIFLSFIFNLWTGYVFAWQSPYPSHTRVIINKHKNINGELIVHNPGNKVWLTQSWLEDEKGTLSGTVLPSLIRLEERFSYKLIIKPYDKLMRGDTEKLLWLNVKFIPSTNKNDDNKIVIPIVYKMKVFIRPEQLRDAESKVSLKCITLNGKWVLINNSRYYLSMVRILSLEGGGKELSPLTLAPLKSYDLDVIRVGGKYKFEYVNDTGEVKTGNFLCH